MNRRPKTEAISEAEDKKITKAAEADPDNLPLTDDDFARMKFKPAKRGVRGKGKKPAKVPKNIRFDPDVLEALQETEGYTTLINDTIRALVVERKAVHFKKTKNGHFVLDCLSLQNQKDGFGLGYKKKAVRRKKATTTAAEKKRA